MESTVFPVFPSHVPTHVRSLDVFAKARYGDAVEFAERWAHLSAASAAVRPFSRSSDSSRSIRERMDKLATAAAAAVAARPAVITGTAADAAALRGVRSASGDSGGGRRTTTGGITTTGGMTTTGGITIAPPDDLVKDWRSEADDAAVMGRGPERDVDPERTYLALEMAVLEDVHTVADVLRCTPNLTTLSLRRSRISDGVIALLPSMVPNLASLDLTGTSGYGAATLITTLARLGRLSRVVFTRCGALFQQADVSAPPLEKRLAAMAATGTDLASPGRAAHRVSGAATTAASVAAAGGRVPAGGVARAPTLPVAGRERAFVGDLLLGWRLGTAIAADVAASAATLSGEGGRPHDGDARSPLRPASSFSDAASTVSGGGAGRPSSAGRPGSALRTLSEGGFGKPKRPDSAVSTGSRAGGLAAPKASGGYTFTTLADVTAAVARGYSLPALLCHALAMAPHAFRDVGFAQCGSVDDVCIYALSGQTRGLAPTDVTGYAEDGLVSDGDDAGGGAFVDAASRAAEAMQKRKRDVAEMRKRMGLAVEAGDGDGGAGGGDAASAAGAGGAATSGSLVGGGSGAPGAGPRKLPPSFYKPVELDMPLFLRSIDVTACRRVTDAALAFLGANAPSLEEVTLALCDQPTISDAGIASIAQGCPKLRVLNLRGCTQLTNTSLAAAARNCPALERVYVATMAVDDAGINLLGASAAAGNLLELDVTRCKGVTVSSIRSLLFKAGRLARPAAGGGSLFMNLTGCTQAEVDTLRATFTSVRFVASTFAETDPSKPALVPTFQPPPKDERLTFRRVFARYGGGDAAAKGKKGKGKKK